MEHLESTPVTSKDGETIYGNMPPSNYAISSAVNDIIDELSELRLEIQRLKKPKYESGYLRSIYG